jgi:Flp pilus assembly protein TadB
VSDSRAIGPEAGKTSVGEPRSDRRSLAMAEEDLDELQPQIRRVELAQLIVRIRLPRDEGGHREPPSRSAAVAAVVAVVAVVVAVVVASAIAASTFVAAEATKVSAGGFNGGFNSKRPKERERLGWR